MLEHVIYLTKEHELKNNKKGNKSLNTFVFNENGSTISSVWVKKNIENNDGSFIIMDHNNSIKNISTQILTERNYFIESVNFETEETSLRINPFDLISDPQELHSLFMNLLYIKWDKNDEDLEAMLNLIDAFTSAVYFIFMDIPEKKNMRVLVKMAQSIRAKIKRKDGSSYPLYQGIFKMTGDPNWVPFKYFNKFSELAMDREEEIAKKVLKFFNSFNGTELEIMSSSDESLLSSFNFKTSVFINANDEYEDPKAKTILFLLMTLLQKSNDDPSLIVVCDEFDKWLDIIDANMWIKDAKTKNIDFLLLSSDLSAFKKNQQNEEFFKTMQESLTASLLIHKNPIFVKYNDVQPSNEQELEEYRNAECVATVLIPSQKIQEEDEVF